MVKTRSELQPDCIRNQVVCPYQLSYFANWKFFFYELFFYTTPKIDHSCYEICESSIFIYRNKQTGVKTQWVSYIVIHYTQAVGEGCWSPLESGVDVGGGSLVEICFWCNVAISLHIARLGWPLCEVFQLPSPPLQSSLLHLLNRQTCPAMCRQDTVVQCVAETQLHVGLTWNIMYSVANQ